MLDDMQNNHNIDHKDNTGSSKETAAILVRRHKSVVGVRRATFVFAYNGHIATRTHGQRVVLVPSVTVR